MPDYLERAYRCYVSEDDVAGRSPDEYFASRAPYLRRIVRDCFPRNCDAAILDVGCGSGALIHFARQAGYTNILGVDRSEAQIQRARAFGIKGVRQDDLLQALRELPSNALDVVVTLDVLEHLPRENVCAFGDEVHRVVKVGGSWIIHTPNAQSPLFGGVRYGDFTHEMAFTSKSITQLAALCGFSKITVREDVPIPHGVVSAIRWFLWKLVRLPLRAFLAIETGVIRDDFILSQNLLAVMVK